MCKTPCCPPQRSSGTGAIVAVIGVLIAVSVLRAILGLLELLAIITMTTVAAVAVLALIIWAVRHHRKAIIASPVQPARPAPALPARYVLAIGNQPTTRLPGATTPRALARQHEHAVRRFADVIASYDDPAAVDDLIHRALRGPDTWTQLPRSNARTP